jgi:hypothetical protein
MFWSATPLGVRIGSDWLGLVRNGSESLGSDFTGANGEGGGGRSCQLFSPPTAGGILRCYLLQANVCRGFCTFWGATRVLPRYYARMGIRRSVGQSAGQSVRRSAGRCYPPPLGGWSRPIVPRLILLMILEIGAVPKTSQSRPTVPKGHGEAVYPRMMLITGMKNPTRRSDGPAFVKSTPARRAK